MSLFRTVTLPCPSCGTNVEFKAVDSINVHRAPEYREQILKQTFQQETCGACDTSFRLDPHFTYLDATTGQWIAVFPAVDLPRFAQREAEARTMFSRSFGSAAPPVAQRLGARLTARATFGWYGLTEKLIVDELELDDVTLELTKALIWRSGAGPVGVSDYELRLIAVDDAELVFSWVVTTTGEAGALVKLPKQVYDDIAANPGDWEAMRTEFDSALYVDLKRMLIEGA